jgi:chemotaxis protein CheX
MTTTSVSQVANNTHESWVPMLEVAAREVFELMLGCKLTVPESPSEEQLDITSMVGLAGQLCGVMSIRCSTKASTIMASKMLGVEPDKVGREMCDAFGEVCNMVAGNFKNKIAGLGDGCMLSVPTVITGNDYSVHSLTDSAALEVRLLFENMPIVILLQIHS